MLYYIQLLIFALFILQFFADLLGILIKDFGVETNPNSVPLRDLMITDKEKEMIIVTMWGAAAENFKSIEKSVIAIRNGSVGEYQEKKKINVISGTLVWVIIQILIEKLYIY